MRHGIILHREPAVSCGQDCSCNEKSRHGCLDPQSHSLVRSIQPSGFPFEWPPTLREEY